MRQLDQQAVATDASISTPVCAALRECIQQRVGGTSLFDEVETVVKSHFPRLEAVIMTVELQSKLSRNLLVTRKLKVYGSQRLLNIKVRLWL